MRLDLCGGAWRVSRTRRTLTRCMLQAARVATHLVEVDRDAERDEVFPTRTRARPVERLEHGRCRQLCVRLAAADARSSAGNPRAER